MDTAADDEPQPKGPEHPPKTEEPSSHMPATNDSDSTPEHPAATNVTDVREESSSTVQENQPATSQGQLQQQDHQDGELENVATPQMPVAPANPNTTVPATKQHTADTEDLAAHTGTLPSSTPEEAPGGSKTEQIEARRAPVHAAEVVDAQAATQQAAQQAEQTAPAHRSSEASSLTNSAAKDPTASSEDAALTEGQQPVVPPQSSHQSTAQEQKPAEEGEATTAIKSEGGTDPEKQPQQQPQQPSHVTPAIDKNNTDSSESQPQASEEDQISEATNQFKQQQQKQQQQPPTSELSATMAPFAPQMLFPEGGQKFMHNQVAYPFATSVGQPMLITAPSSSSAEALQQQQQQQQQHASLYNNFPIKTEQVMPATLQSQQAQDALQSTTAASNSSSASTRRLKVEDALTYLDKVKVHFGTQQKVYNKFLNIMKEFKSQTISTPDVIQSVRDLFEGHPDLIVGFNTFLPPGYKIEIPDESQPTNVVVSQPRKQVEFSHAIQYVNKIKQRFQDTPEVYKSFRRILDTYQKEQQSMTEVYAQLAELFAEHADLLEEFSQFLPEAIPAAKAYKQKQALLRRQAQEQGLDQQSNLALHSAGASTQKGKRRGSSRRSETDGDGRPTKKAREQRQDTQHSGTQSMVDEPLPESAAYVYTDELQFFDHVRRKLQPQPVYQDFLRCLNLYTRGIITKEDLVKLATNFFQKFPYLLQWLKRFLGISGDSTPTTRDIDLNACHRVGVCYRQLPTEFQRGAECAGRKNLDPRILDTLNDRYASFPAWTSNEANFSTGRKNYYEDVLFRVEDERYEMDLLLSSTRTTINAFQEALKHARSKHYNGKRLDLHKRSTSHKGMHLSVLHRLYGYAANNILNALEAKPLESLPVVIKRLQQKQAEWKEVQLKWLPHWKNLAASAYVRSFDYFGPNFKKQDTATLKSKGIRQSFVEMRAQYAKYLEQVQSTGAVVESQPPRPMKTFDIDDTCVDAVVQFVELAIGKVLERTATRESQKAKAMAVLTFIVQYITSRDVATAGRDILAVSEHVAVPAPATEPSTTPSSATTTTTSTENDAATASTTNAPSGAMDTSEDGEAVSINDIKDAAPVKGDGSSSKGGSLDMSVEVQRPSEHDGQGNILLGGSKLAVAIVQFMELLTRINRLHNVCESLRACADQEDVNTRDLPFTVGAALKVDSGVDKKHYWDHFVGIMSDSVCGNFSSERFEEHVTEMFTRDAFKFINLPLGATLLAKQCIMLFQDPLSIQCVGLHLRHRDQSAITPYIDAVGELIQGDASVFKAYMPRGTNRIVVEILGVNAPDTLDKRPVASADWVSYVDTFMTERPELLQRSTSKAYLQRNVKKTTSAATSAAGNTVHIKNLKHQFQYNSYRLTTVASTYEVFARHGKGDKTRVEREQQAQKQNKTKHDKMQGMLESKLTSDQLAHGDALLLGDSGTHDFTEKDREGLSVRVCCQKESTA